MGVSLASPPEESLELLGLTKYKLVLTARATGKMRPLTLLWYRCAARQQPHVNHRWVAETGARAGRRRGAGKRQRSVSST